MNRYIVEFIGTYFLMFTISIVLLDETIGNFAPIAVGLLLTSIVYAGGHISGAHYNPVVTVCFWMEGNFRARDIFPYVVFQTAGAIAATVFAVYLFSPDNYQVLELNTPRALLAEFIFTFALVFVILNVALARGTSGNTFYGIAIGFIVAAGIYSVGDISGGVFNPAVAVGVTSLGISELSNMWIYLLSNTAGGVTAAFTYRRTAR